MSKRNARTAGGRSGALIVMIGLLALGACTNPVGLPDSATSADHTVSSGNHTVSSGNASRADR